MRNSIVSRPTPPSTCKALTRQLIFTKTRNDNLIGIKNLNLWGNDLQDLSLLNQMPNLQVISLSVNNIKTLKYFENCLKLQELYLRKNNIQVLNEIEYLMNLPQLKVLWLCDNPCANVKNYRQVIIKNLPFLTKLDNDVITPTQREKYTGNNQQDFYEIQDKKQMANSKVMPYEGNYISVKLKTNNNLNELEQNQSRLQPNDKNLSDRKGTWKKAQSPSKPLNKGKKAMSYEEQNLSEMKPNNKINMQSDSVQKSMKPSGRGNFNEQTKKNYENGQSNGAKHQNHPKALVGNVSDMIYGGNKISIHQEKNFYEFQKQQPHPKEPYSINPQFMKPLPNFKNQPKNYYAQQNSYQEYSEVEQHSPVKKQPNLSPIKEYEVVEEAETISSQKGSSPNIIMAIMSLLDDLEIDGLEIIKRETERKLVEKRHDQKVSLSSAGKQYKKQ